MLLAGGAIAVLGALVPARSAARMTIGLARHPGQINDAIGLLAQLHDTDLERVVDDWNPHRYSFDAEPYPPVPPALFDAVLEYPLAPLARLLQDPARPERWQISEHASLGLPLEFGEGAGWRILATCPDRWYDLVRHPALGTAVQHLLLDHAEVEARRTRLMESGGDSLARADGAADSGGAVPRPHDDHARGDGRHLADDLP
ncbi:hypothetical protein ABZ281_23990 [Streptomyces sp. NPDC006265]|uniref:hypothetical protein n=1 Tax=Streptomyces sp. NPDC006265 TaxID=3156740 RepID=UPI0033A6BA33